MRGRISKVQRRLEEPESAAFCAEVIRLEEAVKPGSRNEANAQKGKWSAIGEREIRHGEFRVNKFQHFAANFVQGDIKDFADGMQFSELVRCRRKQHFVQLLRRIFHRPFQLSK